MIKTFLTLSLAALSFSTFSYADIEGERFMQSTEAVQQATYGHLDAKALKALIDSQTPFVLLDARGQKWKDNNIILGAKMASYESSGEELAELIPSADALVVVYCYNFTCPLSRKLVRKLVDLGYTNVIEYPAGLSEWRDVAHYPIEIVSN